ncbi:MAG: aldehyde dehydrogenase family protein [Euryarchaeota archaeon]|nr:aldehyde dehydrogenase family protein [Euryarchaeota archaeon]
MPATQQLTKGFENENTVWRLKEENRLDEFHKRYDDALAKCRRELGKAYTLIVDGERVSAKASFDDTNPTNTKEVIGRFAAATTEDTTKAIQSATAAFPKWSRLDPKERIKILRRAGDLMRQRKYEFAAWMTLENGKPRVESMNDVDEAVDFLSYYPYLYEKNDAFHTTMFKPFPNEDCQSYLKPTGAWAVIAPFNFPVAITVGMTVGCILTGNTCVLKPASDTPLVAYKFVELLEDAGVPDGVVNFVTGSGSSVGQTLLDSPAIRGVVFTGSRDVGLKVIESGHKFARPSIIEMGGKNPIIVTAKADVEKAVEGVGRSAFGFSGQKCSAASRVYIDKKLYPEFTKRLVAWTKATCKIGNPEQRDTFIGPVITRKAHDQYLEFVERAKKGGKVLLGGKSAATGALANGHFVEPTIVEGLSDDHWVTCNELFVPIVALYAVSGLEEAVRKANSVEYGLTAGLFSEDPKEVQYFFDNIEAGVCYANRRIGGSTGAIVGGQSFGGWKHSSSTARGAGGPWYLQQFCREQSQTRA